MLAGRNLDAREALNGALVVLPAVTYANVGELAVDVLVATLQPESLGPLESVNVLPMVGNDAYDVDTAQPPGRLCNALELFRLPGRPLAFLQQRAPAMLGRQAAYASELVSWLRAAGAGAVLVLTGLDAQLRRDQQLDSSPFRFIASSDDLKASCSSVDGLLPGQQPLAELEAEISEEELQLHHSLPPWPIVQECTAQGLPCVVLGCFAAEGDNAGEGLQLAAHALRVLGSMRGMGWGGDATADGGAVLERSGEMRLRAPPSWVGLYGRSFPVEIF